MATRAYRISSRPDIGVTYSGSGSNPSLQAKTITGPVETLQVAPTILEALGLDPYALYAARAEGTQVLQG
jgi:hypothetical protein